MAQEEFLRKYDSKHRPQGTSNRVFERVVRGKLEFLRQVRGEYDSRYIQLRRWLGSLMGETPPKLFRGPEMDYDVFICHASEDKETIVRPLLKALVDSGIRVWVDEQEIKWGDSVPGRINKGLENSRFVIIVLSKHFLEKQWTQAELDAVLSTEINDGVAIALPLMVGKKSEHHEILRRIPLLRSKLYLPWASNDAGAVVAALKSRLSQVS